MILPIYTIIHTLISLVAIVTGFEVLFGLVAGQRLDGWTKWFLITAVATTLTGFFFPFHGFTPAIGLALISLPVLALTIFARYSHQLTGTGVGPMLSALLLLSISMSLSESCSRSKKTPP